MPAPQIIHQLVERFTENRDAYRSGRYNEAQVRQEFIDPFFEALGWDVYNKNGFSPEYRDVKIEDSLAIEGTSKAPDYAFKIGPVRKFFVEAKKPSVDIEGGIHPAYQLRRYAWNAHLPLSILTDFEELAVYNCKNKPNPSDSAATGRDKFYRFTEYIEKWDEIAGIFSRDAVWKGSFDRFAESSKGKKGTTEVDDAFLKDIEEWRTDLARNIALRNANVADERQLNFAVQMTIDRIIFLRICEDKGIEPDEQLKTISKTVGVYPQLVELFRRADMKYNSGLFHINKANNSDTLVDTFTPGLTIDDRVLKEIITSIYYPCPYIFKEIPVEILGQVYEQFLGKVIRLTPGHQAKVEEKPEVRKAGGVYYTPKYIVDYIVQNTVGKLLEGKTPSEAAELKIVDPACGSGSFLLGAYQYLLDWHIQWYTANDPEKWAKGKNPPVMQASGGGWKLTTAKKKEILVNNIHGVDIDAQAVEVTKLSLLLKVLEEESGQMSLGLERILPDLGKNIQCGNSLIGDDYFEGQLVIEDKERQRINPFEWQRAFPQVFAKGGFDIVIGNPPYIRIQAMQEWAPLEAEIYKKRYISASKGNYDIYVVFVEKGLSLLNSKGKLGFILPHKFFQAEFAFSLRSILTTSKNLEQIVHFGSQQVFTNATTYTCIMILSKTPRINFRYVAVKSLQDSHNLIGSVNRKIFHSDYDEIILDQPSLGGEEWNFSIGETNAVLRKLKNQSTTLADITRKIFQGIATSADKIYVLQLKEDKGKTLVCFSKALNKNIEIEKELTKPFLMGKDVHRYEQLNVKNVVIFPYMIQNDKPILMPQQFIKNNYPKGWQYLITNKAELSARENGRMEGNNFYAYIYPKNLTEFDSIKILTPEIAFGCQMTLDTNGVFYHTTKVYSFVFRNNQREKLPYFLGLLNSKLLWFFIKSTGYTLRGGYFVFKTNYLNPFPFHKINFSKPFEVRQHDLMVVLVERMLDLHKRTAQTPQEQELLTRDIQSTDREIDKLVYELYELTPEEVRFVEGS